MATITGIKAGTTSITATYGGVTSNSVSFTVSKATGYLTATKTDRTYNGSSQVLAVVSTNSGDYYFGNGSSTTSAPSSWGTKNTSYSATNAGTYYIWGKADASTNYNSVSQKYLTTVTISKRAVTITAPTFVSGTLTYNGSAQTVASGGSCTSGGTMYYYISTSSTAPTVTAGSAPGTGWSTSAEVKATNKGTYYVWYYCYVSDTANNQSNTASGEKAINTVYQISNSKAIGQRTVTVTAPTATNKTYNGSAQTIFSGGSCSTGGTMYFSDTNTTFSTSTWSTTIPTPQRTTAGTYTLYYYAYVSDTTNNTGTNLNTIKSVQATISKKATSAPALTAGTKATYDGSVVYAKAANVSGNPAGKIYYSGTSGNTDYNIDVAAGATTAANLTSMGRKNVGTTTIHAFFRPTDTTNYSDSSVASTTASVTNKATGYATASTSNRTYNGSAQNIATADTNSGDYYFGLGSSTTSAPTSWGTKNTALSQTAAGTYYVWMKADASTNYNAVAAKYIATVTIAQRTVTITAPTKTDRTYTGSAQTIFTAGSASTGGTMYYSASDIAFSTSTWSTTIPYTQKTNAGTYTIYYYCYVSDTANNTGTGINTKKSIQATIGKKATAAPTLTAGTKTTYDGNPVYATAKNGSGNPAGTIYYGTTSGATTYSITASSTATNLTSMGQTNVGSTTIYAFFRPTDTTNYSDSSVASTTASVTNKATGYVTASITNKTYNGSAQTIATKSTNSGDYYFGLGSSTTSAPSSWGSKNTGLSATNAGTYYVWMKADASTNYNAVSQTYIGSVTISQRTVTITAPTKTDRTYNGSAQTIFAAGSCTAGGTMYYSETNTSFSTSTWSTTIPYTQKTTAGTYTIYYYCYVSDTANNTGTNINTIKSVSATIDKKATSAPALTAGTKATYDGSAVYATAANGTGNPAGTIYYGTSAGATTYSMTASSTAANMSSMGRTNVGTTTIHAFFRPTDTTNYYDSTDATTTASVTNRATGYVTASTSNKTYNGSAQTIATKSTNSGDYYFGLGSSTTSAPSSWGSKNTGLSATNAGTYYVWMKADQSTNYNAVSAKYIATVTIAKRTVTITAPTKTDRTYNGSAQTIFAAGSCTAGGTMYYSETNTSFSTSTWSTTIPYTDKTNAGTYTIYYYCYVSDTDNNTGTGTNTSTTLTATIGKKATTAPALTAGSKTTYDGGTVYAKAANVSGNPAGTIYYGASSGATTYNMSVVAGATTATNMTSMGQTSVGTKTIYAFFRPTDTTNYSDSSVASTTAKVVNKANLTVTEVNYSGTYDGSSHSSSVKVTSAGWTGKTIVSGTSTSYGTTVTSNGAVNTVYALKTATDYTASTTIYYKITGDTNYNDYEDSVTFAISRTTGYATASTSNRTYNGSAQTIATKSTNSGDYYFGLGSSTTSAPSSWGSKNTGLSATNAGTYYVWMKADASTNYNAVDAKYIGTVTISKRTVTITAPTKTDRTYTGSNQTIFTAGSASAGGVMYYSSSNINFDKSNSNWSTTIPYTQKSAAGTYTIYWYCLVEDTNNNSGTGINTKNTLTATIGKAASALPSTWSGDSKEYHETAVLTVSGYSGGTIKYRYDANNGTSWTETNTAPTRTAIGSTAVQCMVVGDANHENTSWSSTVTLTVYKSDDARMTVTPGSGLTYNGSAKNIATASNLEGIGTYYLGYKKGGEATADSQVTWGSANVTPLTAINAGTYYIYYKFSPDGNHNNSVPYTLVGTVEIGKATRSGVVSCNNTAYPNTVTATVSGNTENGTVTWGITNGTGKATISSSGVVTPTQAGTVTVTASVAATSNYSAYTATSKTITIDKGTGSIAYSTQNPAAKYCTSNAVASNSTDASKTFTIATSSASSSTNTGASITYGISQSGWSISDDGKTVTVPADTAAGTYDITVTATVAATTNYYSQSSTKSVKIIINANTLSNVILTVVNSSIVYNSTTTCAVLAEYTNGATKDVTSDSGTSYSSNPTGIVTITK